MAQVVESFQVTLCQVEDVDVVADGGAVVRGVVVAEDEQLFTLARGDLRQEWEQVIRHARGVFAHDAAGVAARRVEVTQQAGIPFLHRLRVSFLLCFGPLGVDVVGDHQLGRELGVAVGVRGAERAFFRDGDHAGDSSSITVDGRGGRVDDVGDIVAGGRGEQAQCSVDVDSIVVEGNFARLAHGLQCGEVDDAVDVWVFGEDIIEGLFVGDIEVVELGPLSGEQFYAVDDFRRRVAQIVDDDHFVVGFEEREGGKGADIACATVICLLSLTYGRLSVSALTYPVIRHDPTGMVEVGIRDTSGTFARGGSVRKGQR